MWKVFLGSGLGAFVGLFAVAAFGAREGSLCCDGYPVDFQEACETAALGAVVYSVYYGFLAALIGASLGGLAGAIAGKTRRPKSGGSKRIR